MYYSYIETPIGQLTLFGNDKGLTGINFPSGKNQIIPDIHYQKNEQKLAKAAQQLDEYFSGKRKEFTIPLDINGSDFQKTVWEALRSIPYGQTMSYGDIAKMIGRPTASRAVGMANGRNQIPIIIPCHRVIGADKSLTGFAGGLETKKILLLLEKSAYIIFKS
jgi:methylated-DNA-[protein]-cysteine S-methyltransferase